MKETEFYGRLNAIGQQFNNLVQQFNNLVQGVQNFMQSVRLDSTGKEVRLLALQKLLLKKGLITEAEMTEQAGEVIKEMQAQAEEEAKKAAAPAIVPATPEQTAQVANAPTTDAAVQEAVATIVPPVQA